MTHLFRGTRDGAESPDVQPGPALAMLAPARAGTLRAFSPQNANKLALMGSEPRMPRARRGASVVQS